MRGRRLCWRLTRAKCYLICSLLRLLHGRWMGFLLGSCALCALRRAALLVLKAEAGMCPRRRVRAERSDGPCGRQPPSGCAEERRGWRTRARDCLSAAGASSSETPPAPSTTGCPGAQRRGRRQRGRLLLPSFLGETRKEGAPPGAHPGLRLQHKQCGPPQCAERTKTQQKTHLTPVEQAQQAIN